MKNWLSDRFSAFQILFIFLFPLILAIIAWSWWWLLFYIIILLVVLCISHMCDAADKTWLCANAITTSGISFFAIHSLCLANPTVAGASVLGGYLYSVLWVVFAIIIYPYNKEI